MSLTIHKVTLDAAGRNVKFALSGRLDSVTWAELDAALQPVLSGNVRNLIFDLSELHFISSAGIRLLIAARNKLSEQNGTLLLTNLQPQIVKVMDILKALPGLSIFSSVQELDDYLAAMQQKVIDQQ